MWRIRLILLVALAALVGGFLLIRVNAAPESPTTNDQTATSPATGDGKAAAGTAARPQNTAPVAVVTAVATTQDVAVTRAAVGWVEPIATVQVRPRTDGVIVEERVTDGQIVKAGDVLFRLDSQAIAATVAKDQAEIDKDQATLAQANADLTRDQSLLTDQVVTKQATEQQQATVKSAAATVAMDKAALQADQVQLGYATISAPIAGRVGVINSSPGNLVHAADTTPLLTVTEMAPLRVSFNVPERDLDAYRKALASGTPVAVQAFTQGATVAAASGVLKFIDSTVDTTSGTIIMKAEFANTDAALWPGEYVSVSTQLQLIRGATVVPLVAVQQSDKGAFVYLAKPDRTAAMRPVAVGAIHGDTAVVTSGVSPGDHVVIEGQLRLTDGSPIKESVASSPAVAKAGPAVN